MIACLSLEPECEQNSQTILFSLRCILCNSVHFLGWWFSTGKSSEEELALAAERACKLTNWPQPELMCVAGRGHFFKRLWILKIIFLAEDKLAGLAVIYVVRGGQWMGETECNRGGGCASLPLSIQEIYAALPAEPWYAPSPLVFSWSISPGLQSCPNIFMLELQNLPLQESLHSLTRQLTHLSTHHRSCLFVGLSSPL